ncbi:hypothetical protein D9M69_725960 [compost metagenome]
MTAEKLRLQRPSRPLRVGLVPCAAEDGFIQQSALGVADTLDTSLVNTGLLKLQPDVLNLLFAARTKRALLRLLSLAQLHHQQVAVLEKCVDIDRFARRSHPHVHVRSTA